LTVITGGSSIWLMVGSVLLAETPDVDATRFLGPGLGILLGLIVLIVTFRLVRGRVKRKGEISPPAGFTLSDLRQLMKEGKITPEEFERAKNKVLDATKRATAIKPAQETTTTKQFPPTLQ
jgi:hypothetical protein